MYAICMLSNVCCVLHVAPHAAAHAAAHADAHAIARCMVPPAAHVFRLRLWMFSGKLRATQGFAPSSLRMEKDVRTP